MCALTIHVMDLLYFEWKGLILHLAYWQGYLLSLCGGGENMEFPALLHFCTPPPPFFIDDSGAEFHAD